MANSLYPATALFYPKYTLGKPEAKQKTKDLNQFEELSAMLQRMDGSPDSRGPAWDNLEGSLACLIQTLKIAPSVDHNIDLAILPDHQRDNSVTDIMEAMEENPDHNEQPHVDRIITEVTGKHTATEKPNKWPLHAPLYHVIYDLVNMLPKTAGQIEALYASTKDPVHPPPVTRDYGTQTERSGFYEPTIHLPPHLKDAIMHLQDLMNDDDGEEGITARRLTCLQDLVFSPLCGVDSPEEILDIFRQRMLSLRNQEELPATGRQFRPPAIWVASSHFARFTILSTIATIMKAMAVQTHSPTSNCENLG